MEVESENLKNVGQFVIENSNLSSNIKEMAQRKV